MEGRVSTNNFSAATHRPPIGGNSQAQFNVCRGCSQPAGGNCACVMRCNPSLLNASPFVSDLRATRSCSGCAPVSASEVVLSSNGGAGYMQPVVRFRTRATQYPTLTYTDNRCGGGFDAQYGVASCSVGDVLSYARTPNTFGVASRGASAVLPPNSASPFTQRPQVPTPAI